MYEIKYTISEIITYHYIEKNKITLNSNIITKNMNCMNICFEY